MSRLLLLFVLVLAPAFAWAQGFGGVVRVVDGDTLDVGGTRVRLHGIDAPEIGQHCTRPDLRWDCGTWVAAEVRARIGARKVTCETMDTDHYGRTVARCSVAGQDLGRQLVRDGLALAYRKYSMDYDLDEKAALQAVRGLHGHAMRRPAAHRRAGRTQTPQAAGPTDAACPIKGNIGRSGTRIYHTPGQAFYARTVIRTEHGERWLCSEAEARAAGWRRARR